MNMSRRSGHEPATDAALEGALDLALRRELAPPELPVDFRRRLQAAIARSSRDDSVALRAAAERENADQLAELHAGYVRLRQRTLGTLIGGAFAAGLLITWSLPWISAHFGRNGVVALPAIGVTVGLGLSLRAWWQRSSLARFLP